MYFKFNLIYQTFTITTSNYFYRECVTKSNTLMKGTCFTSSECANKGGVTDGNCAAGINVTNILRLAFLYKNVVHSFSLLTVWLCNFSDERILAQKLLLKCWWNWLWYGSFYIYKRALKSYLRHNVIFVTFRCISFLFMSMLIQIKINLC